MIRIVQLWLLRWQEESLLGSVGHHQALRDLHHEGYEKASADLVRVRTRIALLTPARRLLDEALTRSRSRA